MKAHHSYSILYVMTAALGWAALGSWVLLMPPSVHPMAFSGARGLVIALTFVWVILRMESRPRAACVAVGGSHTRWILVIMAGAAYGFASITYVASLGLIPVGMAAPLHYTTPVFLICGTATVRRMLPKSHEFAGVVLGGLGALVLVSRSSHSATLGVTLAIASAAFWALYIASQGFLSAREKTLAALIGGSIMFLFSIPWYHSGLITLPVLSLLLIAGVVSSSLPLAFLARASASLAPSTISLLLLSEPTLAALLAYITTSQSVEPLKGLGLALITAGAASPFFARTGRA
jgi:drug/metabolite transporter (DMT)-like permease